MKSCLIIITSIFVLGRAKKSWILIKLFPQINSPSDQLANEEFDSALDFFESNCETILPTETTLNSELCLEIANKYEIASESEFVQSKNELKWPKMTRCILKSTILSR